MAEMTMAERVAAAIRDVDGCGLTVDDAHVFCDHPHAENSTLVCGCKRAARAAIEAMREPTRAMQKAGAAEDINGHVMTDAEAGKFYRAMIDEALNEGSWDDG